VRECGRGRVVALGSDRLPVEPYVAKLEDLKRVLASGVLADYLVTVGGEASFSMTQRSPFVNPRRVK
jgi:hypothetical protein